MDSHGQDPNAGDNQDDAAIERPPSIGLDERRMHVRAYNYWASLLDNRLYPSIEDFDPATASKAIRDYEPAVPITFEAFVIGGIALVIGWGATHLCAWPIRRRLRARSLGRGVRAA